MHKAVASGKIEILNASIAAGEALDERDQVGRTPLMYAAAGMRIDLMEILLKAGANQNATDQQGWTAMHFAAQENWADGVRVLAEYVAAVNSQDANGNSPLSRATYFYVGKENAVEVLLQLGANPDLENNHGVSPRKLANRIANYDVRKFFY
jgi:ankyrin repeat protein